MIVTILAVIHVEVEIFVEKTSIVDVGKKEVL